MHFALHFQYPSSDRVRCHPSTGARPWGRQFGCPVWKGEPVWAGEADPELFVPPASGYIALSQGGRAAGGMTVNLRMTGNNILGDERRLADNLAAELQTVFPRAVVDTGTV